MFNVLYAPRRTGLKIIPDKKKQRASSLETASLLLANFEEKRKKDLQMAICSLVKVLAMIETKLATASLSSVLIWVN